MLPFETSRFARYTLCFLTRGDQVLMLHRNRPPNRGLWNGVGGHIEPGETPRANIIREVFEETGFRIHTAHFAGLLTWQGFEIEAGGLFIFTARAPEGDPHANDEGDLDWRPRPWVFSAPEVVSNIHIFLPQVLTLGARPQVFHFDYRDGEIIHSENRPLPDWAQVDLPFPGRKESDRKEVDPK
jgi:8-oxo-dGTP diphosphatase